MRRQLFHIMVAVLAFCSGLWLHSSLARPVAQQESFSAQAPTVAKAVDIIGDAARLSNVKWLYVSQPVSWGLCGGLGGELAEQCGYGYIAVFYEDGSWKRVHVFLSRKSEAEPKLDVGFFDGAYGTELGAWIIEGDEVRVTVNTCICLSCEVHMPVNGYTPEQLRNPFPMVEWWPLRGGLLTHRKETAQTPAESYRLLKPTEFASQDQLDTLIARPFFIEDAWQKKFGGLGEPCSKFYEYEKRFKLKK